MYQDKLLRKVSMDCPLCDKVHDVEERTRISEVSIKGDTVKYTEKYYYCENSDPDECEFETPSMLNANLMGARNAYRIKHHLLTSDEIVAIRKNYGLSQVELAKLMGWGEATISRYESKAIQDESYDIMLRMIRDDPLKALEMLDRNGGNFSQKSRSEIRAVICEKLDSYGREYLSRKTFESKYVNFPDPSDANGYTTLDIDKIEVIISYFAESVQNLFKVKLMKMLWYADALSVKLYGKAMTGLVYRHEAMGALPIGHNNLVNLENINVREEASANYNLMLHFYPMKNADYSRLSQEDRQVLNMVIEKFRNFRAGEIVEYMHQEIAYQDTQTDEIIPFSLAKKIRDF